MKVVYFWFVILFSLLIFSACNDTSPEGGGTLPERGETIITDYIKNTKKDESGGRILYIKSVPSEESGENLWCVNIRYVNRGGVFTDPLLVSQRGEEWRLDKNPRELLFGEWGCKWPPPDEN